MNTNGRVKSVLNQKNEYKNTVFGFLPKDWEIVKLKDISIRKGTYGIGAAAVEYNENLPRYLRITDIDDQGRIINDDPKCVDDPDSVNYILQKNDLVFARTGNTTGKTYLYKKEDGVLVYAGFLIKFSINPIKADSRFVKYFTETNYYWQWVGIMSMRSGQPGINENEYGKLTLPLPPLPEQQKIASILSTWDKAIELKEKLIEQKKEQKKGLMQKLLTGKVRLPDCSGEVKTSRLKGLVKEIKRRNKDNSVSRVLSVTNSQGFINQSDQFGRQVASEDLSTYKIIRKGQFAYNPSRVNVGSIDLLTQFNEGILSPMYVIFETDNARLLSSYLYHFLKSNLFLNQMVNLLQGSVRQSLSFDGLEQIKLFIPTDINEQKKIAQILSLIDKEIFLLEKELKELNNQKKGFMQLLLTGKVRVQV